MSVLRRPPRDRNETRRHLAALNRRYHWVDSRIESGKVTEAARDREVAERNALRFAIAVCERWIAEGGEDDL